MGRLFRFVGDLVVEDPKTPDAGSYREPSSQPRTFGFTALFPRVVDEQRVQYTTFMFAGAGCVALLSGVFALHLPGVSPAIGLSPWVIAGFLFWLAAGVHRNTISLQLKDGVVSVQDGPAWLGGLNISLPLYRIRRLVPQRPHHGRGGPPAPGASGRASRGWMLLAHLVNGESRVLVRWAPESVVKSLAARLNHHRALTSWVDERW